MAGTFVLDKIELCSNRGPSATKQLCPGEGGAFSFMEPAEKGQFSRRGLPGGRHFPFRVGSCSLVTCDFANIPHEVWVMLEKPFFLIWRWIRSS